MERFRDGHLSRCVVFICTLRNFDDCRGLSPHESSNPERPKCEAEKSCRIIEAIACFQGHLSLSSSLITQQVRPGFDEGSNNQQVCKEIWKNHEAKAKSMMSVSVCLGIVLETINIGVRAYRILSLQGQRMDQANHPA